MNKTIYSENYMSNQQIKKQNINIKQRQENKESKEKRSIIYKFGLFLFFTVFMISQSCAASPEITNIVDNVSHGQTLFINGSNFLNENTSDWHMTLAQSRCEGSSPVADGWIWQGNSVGGGYVEDVSLVGDKSLRFVMTGTGGTNCPYDNAGTAVYRSPSNPIVYARAYVRYSSNCGQLFDVAYYVKMFYWMQAGVYIQPEPVSGWPTRLAIKIGGSIDYFNLPKQWTGDRWFCVEAKADNINDEVTVWVDGQFVATYEGALSQDPLSFLLGFVNACPVPADTFYMFTDSATLSTSRIYPLTLVEIGNSPDYTTATKVTQELIHAGENQLEIKCDLNGLGAGPYYLWITNNRQERSNTYSIVGNNEEDTDSPLVSIATPTSGQTLSGTVTISADATDNVGVAGVQFKLDGYALGAEDTTPPYSISWDTTTTDDGAHVLTATARDTVGNQATSISVSVTVDNNTTPPTRSNGSPTGEQSSGTTQTTISLTTNEIATCKYSTSPNITYDNMTNTFANTNSTNHSTTVSGLENGNTYNYYVRCQDTEITPNQNTDDFIISFSIANPVATIYRILDFIKLLLDWLKNEIVLTTDINNDGVVNTRDLGIMMSNWEN